MVSVEDKNVLGYLSGDNISSKFTIFLELRPRKTICYSEQIMSADKYPSEFSSQMHMEGNAYLFVCPSIIGLAGQRKLLNRSVQEPMVSVMISWIITVLINEINLSPSPLVSGYQHWVSWITQSREDCSGNKKISKTQILFDVELFSEVSRYLTNTVVFWFSSRAVWMDFRLEGTRRIVNLLTFMLWGLKAERCDFGGKNRPGAGTLSKQAFLPCPSIIKNSQWRTQIHSKSLK